MTAVPYCQKYFCVIMSKQEREKMEKYEKAQMDIVDIQSDVILTSRDSCPYHCVDLCEYESPPIYG